MYLKFYQNIGLNRGSTKWVAGKPGTWHIKKTIELVVCPTLPWSVCLETLIAGTNDPMIVRVTEAGQWSHLHHIYHNMDFGKTTQLLVFV